MEATLTFDMVYLDGLVLVHYWEQEDLTDHLPLAKTPTTSRGLALYGQKIQG